MDCQVQRSQGVRVQDRQCTDACVVSGSEDGKIYFWELVEVISVVREGGLCDWCVPTV